MNDILTASNGLLIFISYLLLTSLAVEAITEIITSSEVARPLRDLVRWLAYPEPPVVSNRTVIFGWINKLISCGYCTSVWVSAFVIFYSYRSISDKYIDAFIMVFVIHRLSNWIHVFYELVRKGRVESIDLSLRIEDSDDGTDGKGFIEESTEA